LTGDLDKAEGRRKSEVGRSRCENAVKAMIAAINNVPIAVALGVN